MHTGPISLENLIIITSCLALLGLIVWFATVFNGIITLRENTEKAWSNIDVLLKQRHDELPRLVDVARGYMAHEKNTLLNVVNARDSLNAESSVKERITADKTISKSVETLFAVAENYPNLKSNENFLELQKRITRLENEIADRREFFNDSVNLYNIRINIFPEMIIAKILGCREKPMYSVEENAREAPLLS